MYIRKEKQQSHIYVNKGITIYDRIDDDIQII